MEPPPENPPPVRRSLWPRMLLLTGIVVTLTAFYALGLYRYFSWDYLHSHLQYLKTQVQEHRVFSALTFFLLYLLVTSLSLPIAAPLSIVAGALFGLWLGTAVVSLASTLGATAAFLGSRYLFRDFVQRRFAHRLQAINAGVDKEGGYYLFSLRLVPGIPFFLVNLGMGLTQMRGWLFIWISWLAMLPGTFLYVNVGAELGGAEAPGAVLSWGVIGSLVLLAVMPWMLRASVRWLQVKVARSGSAP